MATESLEAFGVLIEVADRQEAADLAEQLACLGRDFLPWEAAHDGAAGGAAHVFARCDHDRVFLVVFFLVFFLRVVVFFFLRDRDFFAGVSGTVIGARIVTSSGYDVLDSAALASAGQWRFRPIAKARRAVIPFQFDLP